MASDTTDLRALAARVLAEEPSRELDADIAAAVGLPEWVTLKYQSWLAGDDDTPRLQADFRRVYAPRYTASHDAAFGAMPAGLYPVIERHKNGWVVILWEPTEEENRWNMVSEATTADLPRAVTAAGLLARAAEMEAAHAE